ISLSNPLTIPVSFRVETSGPFVINPSPPKKRLNSGKTYFETQVRGGRGGGDAARCQGRRRQQSQLADNNSQATRSGDGASCAYIGQRTASMMDTQDHNQHQKQHHPECQHRRTKDLISLLPGQNLQLEVVFLPSRASAEMSECLKSSFSPGTEDIPRLVLRTTGELTIAFCTGHVQRIFLRGEVLRPMITVAPATHSFGTIHTERRGNATLFLGNPTFADAEWSLVHIPTPPSKKRLIHNNNAAKATAAGTTPTSNPARAASGAYAKGRHTGKPGGTNGRGSHGRGPAAGLFNPLVVDDPSVFVFDEEGGVLTGVKLPLKSSAACLPEDWNRFENACWPQQRSRVTWGGVTDCCSVYYPKNKISHHECFPGRSVQGSPRRSVRKDTRPMNNVFLVPGARPAMPAAVVWRDEPHGQRQVVGPTLNLEIFLTRKEETAEGYRAPRPLEVVFVPKHNVLYRSRFRLTVKGGESAEVVLEGCGTYREDFRPGKLPRV
ncbi:unnamed protein product, partial [Ectocarpus sp. 13 AM-2016]